MFENKRNKIITDGLCPSIYQLLSRDRRTGPSAEAERQLVNRCYAEGKELEDLILSKLKEKSSGHADDEKLALIAKIWSDEINEIISLILEYTEQARGRPKYLSFRSEAIFELAKLYLFLTEKVIEVKLADKRVEDLNPADERAALFSAHGRERIENTAQVIAEHLWIKLYDQWQRRMTTVIDPEKERARRRGRAKLWTPEATQERVTQKMHYSPDFTNKYWADSKGMIRIFSLKVDGSVTSRIRPYGAWGYEYYLYPQWLEDYFSKIEAQAEAPYRKLVEFLPLTEQERRRWITFLIVQVIRTPSFILELMGGLKEIIKVNRWTYSSHPESLLRAYTTLFQNDRLYAYFVRLIAAREWRVLQAAPDAFFIKPDDPAVIITREKDDYWALAYPLSPNKCFVAGPGAATRASSAMPTTHRLDQDETERLNAILAGNARREVITGPGNDQAEFQQLLEQTLGGRELRRRLHRSPPPPHWGKPRQLWM